METEGQWCDNAFCPDHGKIDADNIKIQVVSLDSVDEKAPM